MKERLIAGPLLIALIASILVVAALPNRARAAVSDGLQMIVNERGRISYSIGAATGGEPSIIGGYLGSSNPLAEGCEVPTCSQARRGVRLRTN